MNKCKHVAFTLVDSKVFDNDGTEIGCTGGGLIKCTDCETTVFNIQQENIQLKSDLQSANKEIKMLKELNEGFRSSMVSAHDYAKKLESDLQVLRELLKEVEFNWDGACNICHETMKHEPGCRMKAELDQLKGVE